MCLDFTLLNPCSAIRNVVAVLKTRSDALILYVLQNTSRRSAAKKHFPKGNRMIHVLLHCEFSVMDAGIN